MSLADKIIEGRKQEQKKNIDELGLGIADNLDYIAARMLKINYDAYIKGTEGMLHRRRDGIYIGNKQLKQNMATLYERARPHRTLKAHEVPKIWEIVRKNLPELDETKVLIDEYTYWDISTGELVKSDKKMYGI